MYILSSGDEGPSYCARLSLRDRESNPPSAFISDLPFVIAIVKLEETGVQMLSNIVECDPYEVECDMPVEVVFEKLNDEITLPKFKPIKA